MSGWLVLPSDPNHREFSVYCEELPLFLRCGRYFNVTLSKRTSWVGERSYKNLLVVTRDVVPGNAPSRISQILTPAVRLDPSGVRLTGLSVRELLDWLGAKSATPRQCPHLMAELREAIESALPVLHSE